MLFNEAMETATAAACISTISIAANQKSATPSNSASGVSLCNSSDYAVTSPARYSPPVVRPPSEVTSSHPSHPHHHRLSRCSRQSPITPLPSDPPPPLPCCSNSSVRSEFIPSASSTSAPGTASSTSQSQSQTPPPPFSSQVSSTSTSILSQSELQQRSSTSVSSSFNSHQLSTVTTLSSAALSSESVDLRSTKKKKKAAKRNASLCGASSPSSNNANSHQDDSVPHFKLKIRYSGSGSGDMHEIVNSTNERTTVKKLKPGKRERNHDPSTSELDIKTEPDMTVKRIKVEPTTTQLQEEDCAKSHRDIGCNTHTRATMTEPDLLGPCEPGTKIRLEGTVWLETCNGMLVINVNWRGRTYVGTLLDSSKHDFAPPCPRHYVSAIGASRSRFARGRGKRRGGIYYTNTRAAAARRRQKRQQGSGAGVGTRSVSGVVMPGSGLLSSLDDPDQEQDREPGSDGRDSPESGVGTEASSTSPFPIGCTQTGCHKRFADMTAMMYHLQQRHSRPKMAPAPAIVAPSSRPVITVAPSNQQRESSSLAATVSPVPKATVISMPLLVNGTLTPPLTTSSSPLPPSNFPLTIQIKTEPNGIVHHPNGCLLNNLAVKLSSPTDDGAGLTSASLSSPPTRPTAAAVLNGFPSLPLDDKPPVSPAYSDISDANDAPLLEKEDGGKLLPDSGPPSGPLDMSVSASSQSQAAAAALLAYYTQPTRLPGLALPPRAVGPGSSSSRNAASPVVTTAVSGRVSSLHHSIPVPGSRLLPPPPVTPTIRCPHSPKRLRIEEDLQPLRRSASAAGFQQQHQHQTMDSRSASVVYHHRQPIDFSLTSSSSVLHQKHPQQHKLQDLVVLDKHKVDNRLETNVSTLPPTAHVVMSTNTSPASLSFLTAPGGLQATHLNLTPSASSSTFLPVPPGAYAAAPPHHFTYPPGKPVTYLMSNVYQRK